MFLSTVLTNGLIFHFHSQLNDQEKNEGDVQSENILLEYEHLKHWRTNLI